MKQISTLFLFLLLGFSSPAQLSRSKNRTPVACRNNYQRMATGCTSDFSFEIRNGALWATGLNDYGELGDGTTTNRFTPVQIGTATNWVSISCGNRFAIGITSDGKLWAWGSNASGNLGDGTNTDRHVPTQIGAATNWVSVAGGGVSAAAISADGKLWAWGDNQYGQLGDGTLIAKNVPQQVGSAANWVNVTCGSGAMLALAADGKLWACGRNSAGHLGDGTNTNRSLLTLVSGGISWACISSGPYHAVGISADGKLYAWGNNFIGQLGDGTLVNKSIPTQIGTDANWVSISCGNSHNHAIKTDGTLWGWGENYAGTLGDGTTNNTTAPIQIGNATNWVSIAAGNAHSLATTADGKLWAWGHGYPGQLGTGNSNDQYSPVQTRNALQQWLSVSGTTYHNVALKGDGTLWSVGQGTSYQIGDGSTRDKKVPIQVGNANNWIGMASGAYHTVAISADGKLYAWGYNSYGGLGNNSFNPQNTPTQIGTAANWTSVACGGYHTAAIRSDGTLWGWGENSYGAVGDGTTTHRSLPVQVTSPANTWVSVAAGEFHTVAISADGKLWAWGQNTDGELGTGNNTNSSIPVQVGIATNWLSVTCGAYYTIALSADGKLWAWGLNFFGQLGVGSTVSKNVPTQIGIATNWLAATGGFVHSNALNSSGQLYAWGGNSTGQVGDGTTTNKNAPSLIAAQTGVTAIMGNIPDGYNSATIKAERDKICMTGYNPYGELADGTTTTGTSYNCNNDWCAFYSLANTATGYTQPLGGIGNRTDFQHGCAMVCALIPAGLSPAVSNTTSKVWLDPSVTFYNGAPFVTRHYEVLPSINPTTVTGTIILYYTQAEFTAYNAAANHGADLPIDATDAANNKANLKITKRGGSSSDASGQPGTYTGVSTLIIPDSVVWDDVANRWAVTFDVTGFGGFFITTTINPLPVKLLHFTAQKQDGFQNRVDWQSAMADENTTFHIERSGNGSGFTEIGAEKGNAAGSAAYTFYDEQPLASVNYYRLKITEAGGQISYSTIAIVRSSGTGSIAISPVPASDYITIISTDAALIGTTAVIWDMHGKQVYRTLLTAAHNVDISTWPAGIYMLRLVTGEALRIVKQ